VGCGTDLGAALEFVNRTTKRRAVVFLLSDFWAAGFEKSLRIAAKRHDLVALRTVDPAEFALPAAGLIALRDLEGGHVSVADLLSRRARHAFSAAARHEAERIKAICESAGVDMLEMRTDASIIEPLLELFERRYRRRAH